MQTVHPITHSTFKNCLKGIQWADTDATDGCRANLYTEMFKQQIDSMRHRNSVKTCLVFLIFIISQSIFTSQTTIEFEDYQQFNYAEEGGENENNSTNQSDMTNLTYELEHNVTIDCYNTPAYISTVTMYSGYCEITNLGNQTYNVFGSYYSEGQAYWVPLADTFGEIINPNEIIYSKIPYFYNNELFSMLYFGFNLPNESIQQFNITTNFYPSLSSNCVPENSTPSWDNSTLFHNIFNCTARGIYSESGNMFLNISTTYFEESNIEINLTGAEESTFYLHVQNMSGETFTENNRYGMVEITHYWEMNGTNITLGKERLQLPLYENITISNETNFSIDLSGIDCWDTAGDLGLFAFACFFVDDNSTSNNQGGQIPETTGPSDYPSESNSITESSNDNLFPGLCFTAIILFVIINFIIVGGFVFREGMELREERID